MEAAEVWRARFDGAAAYADAGIHRRLREAGRKDGGRNASKATPVPHITSAMLNRACCCMRCCRLPDAMPLPRRAGSSRILQRTSACLPLPLPLLNSPTDVTCGNAAASAALQRYACRLYGVATGHRGANRAASGCGCWRQPRREETAIGRVGGVSTNALVARPGGENTVLLSMRRCSLTSVTANDIPAVSSQRCPLGVAGLAAIKGAGLGGVKHLLAAHCIASSTNLALAGAGGRRRGGGSGVRLKAAWR